jgi:hypothetical protein
VPAAELDEFARSLLRRNAYALVMTKQLPNRRALIEFAAQHGAALGYEFLNFYMQTPGAKARAGDRGEDTIQILGNPRQYYRMVGSGLRDWL